MLGYEKNIPTFIIALLLYGYKFFELCIEFFRKIWYSDYEMQGLKNEKD